MILTTIDPWYFIFCQIFERWNIGRWAMDVWRLEARKVKNIFYCLTAEKLGSDNIGKLMERLIRCNKIQIDLYRIKLTTGSVQSEGIFYLNFNRWTDSVVSILIIDNSHISNVSSSNESMGNKIYTNIQTYAVNEY